MPRPEYSPIAAVAVLVALALGLAGSCHSGFDDAGREPLHATVLPEPLPLPAFTLHDAQNEPFTRESLLGRTSLLFFGFTHCPDICPATLQQLALARKQLQEQHATTSTTDAGGLPPEASPQAWQIVFISVDPERDTPEKLKAYVSHFGEGVVGATGSLESIREITSALGIWSGKEALGEDDYTVSHSTAVLVIGEDATFRALFSAPHKTEYFVHDLPLLMAAR
jgi:protein SCO1/2